MLASRCVYLLSLVDLALGDDDNLAVALKLHVLGDAVREAAVVDVARRSARHRRVNNYASNKTTTS